MERVFEGSSVGVFTIGEGMGDRPRAERGF